MSRDMLVLLAIAVVFVGALVALDAPLRVLL